MSNITNKKTKNTLLNISISILAIIIILVVGETVARIADYPARVPNTKRPSHNPILVYEHKPFVRVSKTETFNSQGLRDKEYSFKKPENTIRIVVIGDSVAYGDRVKERDNIFSEILENDLNEREEEINYEVINFAVAGYNIVQDVESYKEYASKYDPDVILLAYILNDPDKITFKAVEGKRFSPLISTAEKSHFINFLFDYARALFNKQKEYPNDMDYVQFLHSDEQFQKVIDSLENLAIATKDRKTMVILFPALKDLDNYKWNKEHEKVRRLCEELGFDFLDLLPFYQLYRTEELKISPLDYYHPNELGHKIAAKAIGKFMEKKGYLSY